MSNIDSRESMEWNRTYLDQLYEILSTRRSLILITTVPVLVVFTFVSLVPMVWGVITSLFNVPLFASWNWTWVGLENYSYILSQQAFQASFWRSILFAFGSVALQLTFGVGLALLINHSFKFANGIRAIAMLPYLIPTAVVAFLAQFMANSSYGVINDALVSAGLLESGIAWFGSTEFVMAALVVVNSWKFAIFVTLMTLARLQGIPSEFYEAATMAGANSYQRFRDITLPNLKGVIFIVLLLRGIWMFNKFDIIQILTQGGPAEASKTLPIYGYQLVFRSSELSQATTVSTIMFILLFVVAILYFHFLNPSKEVRVE